MTRRHWLFIIIACALVALTAGIYVGSRNTPIGVPLDQATLFGSRNSDVYHMQTCRHAQRIHRVNLVGFEDAEQAEGYGYRACRVCGGRRVRPSRPRPSR